MLFLNVPKRQSFCVDILVSRPEVVLPVEYGFEAGAVKSPCVKVYFLACWGCEQILGNTFIAIRGKYLLSLNNTHIGRNF